MFENNAIFNKTPGFLNWYKVLQFACLAPAGTQKTPPETPEGKTAKFWTNKAHKKKNAINLKQKKAIFKDSTFLNF